MKSRNAYLDVVRGLLILFACSEHFTQFLNDWYIETFKKSDIIDLNAVPVLVQQYFYHLKFLGHILSADPISSVIALMFVPWVTHMFIGFAGYNIVRKKPTAIKQNLAQINKGLLFMFFLFYAENFVVTREFFGGLLMLPVVAWMLILIFSNYIYGFFGLSGVLLTFILSLALKVISNLGYFQINYFSHLISSIHPRVVESTEPLNYLPACLAGMLIGIILNQKERSSPIFKKLAFLFGASTLFFLWNSRQLFKHDPLHVFSYDELLTTNNFGVLFIISIIGVSLTLLHQLDKKNPPKWLLPLQYVGANSLGIFLIHRILFIDILAPIRFHLGSYFKLPMTNNIFEVMLIYFPCTVLCYWLLTKFGFFGPLFAKNSKASPE